MENRKIKLGYTGNFVRTRVPLAQVIEEFTQICNDNDENLIFEDPNPTRIGNCTFHTDGTVSIESFPDMYHAIEFEKMLEDGRDSGPCRVVFRTVETNRGTVCLAEIFPLSAV